MGAWDIIRYAAGGLESPAERVAQAEPSLRRNGLYGLIDPDGDGRVRLDTGHVLSAGIFDDKPDWGLTIMHRDRPNLDSAIRVHMGTRAEGVGDRMRNVLGHPAVMHAMREQMEPHGEDKWVDFDSRELR
jgi:hypothetical protein